MMLQDPRDAEDAVKALHRTEICGMRATVKMAREKEEERAQARDRMLRCQGGDDVSDDCSDHSREEMAKKKAKLEAEESRRGGTYRTREDFESSRGSSGSSSSSRDHRDRDYGRGRSAVDDRDRDRDRRDDRRDHRRDDRRERDHYSRDRR